MRKFGPENFDFPIVGSKIKVVVESSVTYQNLLAENSKFKPRSGTWQFVHLFCLLPGRRSPRLTVTLRGSWRGGWKPGRWSPWGMEVLWREGRKIISIKIANWSKQHLVRQHIRLARSFWFAGHSRFAKSCNLFVELWFGFTFPFRSFLYLFVV